MATKDERYRPEHQYVGIIDSAALCERCGHLFSVHRTPRKRVDSREARVRKPPEKKPTFYIGLDGEGQGRENHLYNLLAASDESGEYTWHIENPLGISTEAALNFLCSFPRNAKLFAYSFNYDLTKMLTDVDDRSLYYLFRPELRQRFGKDAFKGPRSVAWRDWHLNLQGTKFSIRRNSDKRCVVVWDIWKFFQSKFTGACTDWKVGSKEEIDRMILMKDKRHLFDRETREAVLKYCFTECRFMAELARKLTDAHTDIGLLLKNYFGAGSSATAMLTKMNVKEHIKEAPGEVIEPISIAFAGGRFDNSVIGMIKGKVRGWDISSAYPYQAYQLPCLTHGTWEKTDNRNVMEGARLACVHYRLPDSASVNTKLRPWGPFSFRERSGSICYPAVSGGGWAWRDEYLEAERLFGNVVFLEAWCYHTNCTCQPFKDVGHYYTERLRIGKEAAGIALKLAINSCYGKTAQSVGSGPFRSWVYAGMITSGCRAQVLHALGLHKDWRNMLMVATDGILTLEDIKPPKPVDTGTDYDILDESTGEIKRKPLGGWEDKDSDRGVFIARPGVYFPLNPSEKDIKIVRGRGVGRGVILENHPKIVGAWMDWKRTTQGVLVGSEYDRDDRDHKGWPLVKVANVSRFCGAKSSISRSMVDGQFVYKRAQGEHIGSRPAPRYGQWITREVSMSFNPFPKRDGLEKDMRSLKVRKLDESVESAPYKKANISEEARQLLLMTLEANEQPDGDLADYE